MANQELTIGDYYQHNKTLGVYRIIAFGLIEETKVHSVVYESVPGGSIWIRPTKEFFDGRFTWMDPDALSFNILKSRKEGSKQ